MAKEMIYRFVDAINEKDFKALDEVLHDDATFRFPKIDDQVGKKAVIRFFKVMSRKYTELKWMVYEDVFEGDQAVLIWDSTGELRGGGSYENEGVTTFKLKDGKLLFISDYLKRTEMF